MQSGIQYVFDCMVPFNTKQYDPAGISVELFSQPLYLGVVIWQRHLLVGRVVVFSVVNGENVVSVVLSSH